MGWRGRRGKSPHRKASARSGSAAYRTVAPCSCSVGQTCIWRSEGGYVMELTFENITLRDYVLSDVEDEVRWTNVETEWFRSDTPWMELAPVDADELRADMSEIINSMPENAIRWRFEIEVDGRHIGLVLTTWTAILNTLRGKPLTKTRMLPKTIPLEVLVLKSVKWIIGEKASAQRYLPC